jgi:putative pyruvate formate lyase activating enzyme
MDSFEPAFLSLLKSGELNKRVETARERMKACDLCARYCGVDRNEKQGACKTGVLARIASFNPHHGEENPLRGRRGSGTIFFSSCNLRCQYCQNYDISQRTTGDEIEPEELAVIMLWLQKVGCHNINFVSPSHVVAQILEALVIAAENGLKIPLVYNTGGFDSLEALEILDGVIDIYMPDMKYSDSKIARRMSKIGNYFGVNKKAVKEMHRQVGDLVLDEQGIAQRGLLIRHLVLPSGMAGSAKILRFLAEEISTDTYINIMAQYRPAYRALEFPPFDRSPSRKEYTHVLDLADKYGLHRLDSRNR